MTNEDLAQRVRPYTMTPPGVILNTAWALDQVLTAGVPGAFVECGVWRGGHCMMAALKFLQTGDLRDVWLFDTFEGMSKPTEWDVRGRGAALPDWEQQKHPAGGSTWCRAELPDVRAAMATTAYPVELVHFVQGKVEDTLPVVDLPKTIAVLRLDTDWYESTRVEMDVLYPRLATGGVLILDDYNYWRGSRKAVDEYFQAIGVVPKLKPCAPGAGACYLVKP